MEVVMNKFTSKKELFQRILDLKTLEKAPRNLDLKTVNPLVLAHIGDAYFSLFVRQKIISFGEIKINDLHKISAEMVSAASQKTAYEFLEQNILTEEEKEIFRRGRNAKSHLKKNATVAVYHASTGFEALLGFYFLSGEKERLEEIVEAAFWFIVENYVEE